MTPKELIETTKDYALRNINVNMAEDGDVYEILNNIQARYGAIIITPISAVVSDNTYAHNLYIYYADRLHVDGNNVNDIYSTAAMTLDSILTKLRNTDGVLMVTEDANFIYFTQKFADNTAGAYVNVQITTTKPNICSQI